MIRIGHGYDVHQLVPERALILGGVTVPHSHGLLGHSDADVLLHAVCDAILGALALGDLGCHFPDTAAEFKDIASTELLRRVISLTHLNDYTIGNLDATIIAQKPRLAEHLPEMVSTIASLCQCSSGHINVKATTTEKLGFEGRLEGISAHAVVLLTRSQSTL
ncbi:MAG: 2-C-methyl-D-erythritol 2,4-cyclodiphosphate synthase [Desulfuromonadaceae bacterium]|nr:2-C-methyl-D-erythritol 2,4-cyclodiphosphate synthase [Desulfuromonadaceae bacterium]